MEFKLLLSNIIDWDNHLRSWFTSLAGITASLFISAPLTGFTSDVPEFIRIVIFIAFILVSPLFFCYMLHVFIRIHESLSVKVCLRDLMARKKLVDYKETVDMIQDWLIPFEKEKEEKEEKEKEEKRKKKHIRDRILYHIFQFRGFYPGMLSVCMSLNFVFINYLDNSLIFLIFILLCFIGLLLIVFQIKVHLKIRKEIKKASEKAGIRRKGRLW